MNLNYYTSSNDGYLSHSEYSGDDERIYRSENWYSKLDKFENELELNKLKASVELIFELYKQLCLIKKQYDIEITLDYGMGLVGMRCKFLNEDKVFCYYEEGFPETKKMIDIKELCSDRANEIHFGDLPDFTDITNVSEKFAQDLINQFQYLYEIATQLIQEKELMYWSDISSSNQYIKDLFNCEIPELKEIYWEKLFVVSKEFKSIRKKMLAVYKKNFKDDKVF